ncbi:MAG: DUF2784 domain-containing protein [Verrucomicrobia bacterium]|nr:DUF2784 domain-containing protein [Verrucomicrobiota bacterium]MCH8513933.1 DUF2784 domain-containing protein [Kiritimatiellia bacterium]
MSAETVYLLAADAILFVHLLFVLFVVVSLLLILAGGIRGWAWVRNRRFRLLHFAAIGYVVVQAWLGMICPLTIWEMALRDRAGDATYTGGFIAHWMERLLYFEAPNWVFAVAYTLFAALVAASWIWVRPQNHAGS